MKQHLCITQRRVLRTALSAATSAILIFSSGALAATVTQSGEQKNVSRVGHTDLQGRPAYQPNVIQYPDGRWIAFSGTHNNIPVPRPGFTFLPNPLNNNADERNGTMIIDVTDPANPTETAHIPAPVGGQAQMARMCLGSDLNEDLRGKVYLMRNVQGGADSGYEVWDVTDVKKPVMASALRNIRNTHKLWWECNTGIAYLPGSKDATFGLPLWRQAQSMVIVDWQNPHATPTYLRTYGLVGAQPGATGPVPPSLHGPISAHEHPFAANRLARGATADDIIGNRIYSAWGVGDDGVLTIEDRKKLLPPLSGGRGGTYAGDPDQPTAADLEGSLAGILYMSPDQGGHSSFPVFGLKPSSYQAFTEFQTRDIVLLASESTADLCDEAPHWSFIVDVTVENSKSAPPGTRVQQNVFQGPMVLSTMHVDPFDGEKFPRGNYCLRGARFGVHSSEENFNNPLYGKLTAIAYFTGGVRIWDIREPHAPVEVGFYVPESNANTNPDGYMTNNVEIDDRGFIYVVDRNGAGLDILQLTGKALDIVFPAARPLTLK
jgi:LVIVD repeat